MASLDPVFLDTNALVALLVADDALHREAVIRFEALGRTGRPLVTTDWVLAELGNSLARTPARSLAAEFIVQTVTQPQTRVVFVDQAMLIRGLKRYNTNSDKAWGLVDCVSFEVMVDTGCREAFTHDRHFEQAGFRRLLEA